MQVKEIQRYIESLAPAVYQESYDNAGLLVGNGEMEVTGVVVCLDAVESVVEEAIAKGCNLIVAHHPIIFGGLKRLTGSTYIERTVIRAIKHDVAILAVHTNLDNMLNGVNSKIAQRLGLEGCRILAPQRRLLRKLYTFAPAAHAEAVRQSLFSAGAGHIGNYDQCSFNAVGAGTFRAGDGTRPFVGEQGKPHTEPEIKIEVVFAQHLEGAVVRALREAHPYEEPAFDILTLDNEYDRIGAGLVGELPAPMPFAHFLLFLKAKMNTPCVRYTRPVRDTVQRIAVCGGAGSFLLGKAIAAQADVLVSADFKYHQFFDADGKIVVADIGHFESEQFTIDWLHEVISQKFTTFAVHLVAHSTNPINYS